MGCQKWNEKSDLWCVACIAIEMYTGDLYFQTRKNDYEHLAMIEKSCGNIPKYMVAGIKNETAQHFESNGRCRTLNTSLLKWPIGASVESVKRVKDMKLVDDLIPPKFSQFIDLIRKMMIIDPTKRITAVKALEHPFF